MLQRYFLTTGVLILDQVTPVIEALFGGFNFRPAPPGADDSRVATIPTWSAVLERLVALAAELSIRPSEGALDNMASALLLLSAHFGCFKDAALVDFIEHHPFEGEADLDTLYIIARRFDDGHGLKDIRLNSNPCHAELVAHSAADVASEMLDMLSDVLPLITDEAVLEPLRRRLARMLAEATRTAEGQSDANKRH